METLNKQTINQIVSKFTELNGASFVAIPNYTSKTSGEIANHLVNCNFSYANAVEKDLKALQNIDAEQIENICKLGFKPNLINEAIEKLKKSFIDNQNKETASNQSIAQNNAFVPVTNSIKLCLESGLLHIYAMAINKKVIVKGEHKKVNSRELTLCQNAIKKELNFSTTKYRSFIVSPENLSKVKISGNEFELI